MLVPPPLSVSLCDDTSPHALNSLNGYDTLPGGGCRDVDECADDPCTEGQVCINTPGSFRCETCHESCDQDKGCTDSGADKCIACASGFFENDNGGGLSAFNCLLTHVCPHTPWALTQGRGRMEGWDNTHMRRGRCRHFVAVAVCPAILLSLRVLTFASHGITPPIFLSFFVPRLQPPSSPLCAARSTECEDVDDCKDFPCEADKTCNNQPGSFSCSCTPPAFEVWFQAREGKSE